MLVQLFFLGFAASWGDPLLSSGAPKNNIGKLVKPEPAPTTSHAFRREGQDDDDLNKAQEILGINRQQRGSSDNSGDSGPHTTPHHVTPNDEKVTPEKVRRAVQTLEEELEAAKHKHDDSRLIALQTLATKIVDYSARTDLGVATEEKLKQLSEDPLVKEQMRIIRVQFVLQVEGVKGGLNSQTPEVRKAACKKLEGIIGSFETGQLPHEWDELVTHHTYQAYLQKKSTLNKASSQSKTARRGQEETAAASWTNKEPSRKKQAKETVISIPAIEGLGLSREDEIRQEWAEATKDLKLNKKDLDDDDLEVSQGRINADYQCRLGELFEKLEQDEDAKREYQKAVLELWNIEERHPDIQWKEHPATLKENKTFLSIYKRTVGKCREKQDQHSVPPYYTFSGACDGLVQARYRMDLGDYDEAASYLKFFEGHGPDWSEINSSKYNKECKKYKRKNGCLAGHQVYYVQILEELRKNIDVQEAYNSLEAQSRRDFWTLGVGGATVMAAVCTGFLFLMNYFLPKDPGATDTNELTNPFGGLIGNVTESFSPGSNFSNFLQDVITNATFIPSAQPQNISSPDNFSTTLAPFAFSSTLAPAVQGCTDLARCLLANATFVGSLNRYLIEPSCGSTPAQFLHNLTCALIGKYYQYTQALNMMCVLVKLQEWNWVGVCAPTLPEDQDSIQLGTACLEPGPIAPVRRSSINLEIHRQRFNRFSEGSCATKRQANPFVPTETRELTESEELTNTHSEELSPDKSASFSDTAASGTRDDSASRSQTPLRKKQRSLTEPPSLSHSHLLSRSQSPSLSPSASFNPFQLYWANFQNAMINFANVTGPTLANAKILLKGNNTFSQKPCGLHIDTKNNKIYWTDYGRPGPQGLYSGDIDPLNPGIISNIQSLAQGKAFCAVFVDSKNEIIYYGGFQIPLYAAHINLQIPSMLINETAIANSASARTVSVDVLNGKIYWPVWDSGNIWVGDIDPENPRSILNARQLTTTSGSGSVEFFTVDFASSMMYYRKGLLATIYAAKLNLTAPSTPVNETAVVTDSNNLMGNQGGIFVVPN